MLINMLNKPDLAHGGVRVWLGGKGGALPSMAGKPAPFAGEGPLSGSIPSTLTELLHSVPVPRKYHLSDTAALGITTRAVRRGKGLPPLMAAAAAERVAVDATALLTAVRSKKKNRAERLGVLETLLRSYLDPRTHAAATADLEFYSGDSTPKFRDDGKAGTLLAQQGAERMGVALRRVAAVYDARGNGPGDVAGTITGDHDSRVTDYTKICVGVDSAVAPGVGDIAAMTLDELAKVAQAHVAAVGRRYILRRFTPEECLALQGFPVDHCDVPHGRARLSDADARELLAFHAAEGRRYTIGQIKAMVPDTARYRTAGNSMAVPCLKRIMHGVEAHAGYRLRRLWQGRFHEGAATGFHERVHQLRAQGVPHFEALERCAEERGVRIQRLPKGVDAQKILEERGRRLEDLWNGKAVSAPDEYSALRCLA